LASSNVATGIEASVEYRIDLQQGIVHLTGPDPSLPEDFVAVLQVAMVDPAFRIGFGFLRDRRGVVPPSVQYVEAVARLMRAMSDVPPTRYAILVDTLASYGMMRLARKRTWGAWVEMDLFETMAEAVVWIKEQRRSETTRSPFVPPAAEGEAAL
jgi:hypothetical protein